MRVETVRLGLIVKGRGGWGAGGAGAGGGGRGNRHRVHRMHSTEAVQPGSSRLASAGLSSAAADACLEAGSHHAQLTAPCGRLRVWRGLDF